MQKTIIEKDEIKLVGISVRTSYQKELIMMFGSIFPLVMRYFNGALAEKISNRKQPGTTISAYTDFESDYKGAYTYFIGEEVSSFESTLPEGFQTLTIPKQKYAKFTTKAGPLPDVIVNAWKSIWAMQPEELGGKRSYQTDFEVYDERAKNRNSVIIDLFVGIN